MEMLNNQRVWFDWRIEENYEEIANQMGDDPQIYTRSETW
jgi:hypothetical protein